MVRLSESGRWVDIRPSGVRLAGAETFQRDLTQRVIINGEQTVEFVYIVAVQRGDVSINAVGRQMPVSK